MTETLRPVEVELKYRVLDMTAAERYLVAPSIGAFVGASQARSTQMEDRYVDTADRAFERAGFAVRLRSSGTGVIVSIKSLSRREGAGGSVGREEIEGPAIRAAGPSDWPASDARSLVLELAGDAPLVEVVTIRQLRRKRQLRDGSTRVELSLDEVDVVASKRVVARFVELEAELTKGNEARLNGLATVFRADPALSPAMTSKFEAALAAMRPAPTSKFEAALAALADVTPDDDVAVEATAVEAPAAVDTPSMPEELAAEPEPAAMETTEAIEAAETNEQQAPEAAADEAVAVAEPVAEAPPIDPIEAIAAAEPPVIDLDVPEPEHDPEAAADAEADAAEHEADLAAIAAAHAAAIDAAEPVDAVVDEDAEVIEVHATSEDVPTTSDVVSEAVEAAAAESEPLAISKTAGVTADDHIAEAGRKVMRFHLARMLAREAGTRLGKDPEELHAMRVATRRQRAAWRVFGGSFRTARTKKFRKGLRETAARLGAVRDLDVLLEAADHYRADLPVTEQRALEPLLADWRNHREGARVLLARELDSEGYRRWVDDYRDFVRTEGAGVLPVGPVEPHRVRDTAPSAIWTAYEQVRGYEPVLRWADVETLHDLRIAGKWLRYTLEFVKEALGPDSAPLIARVTALQDHLGLMHDADVSASMARAFLVEHAGQLSSLESAAIGRYLVNREREVARLRRTLNTTWRGVDSLAFRRALGRVVAGL